MGNAQEAIKDYKKRTQAVQQVKIATNPDQAMAMVLDHKYDEHSNVSYLAQRLDGTQRWVKNPSLVC